MKVELIVVQGKPEGKVIPLAGPRFKIGRGEGCNLRPNSEEVSREHAEFSVIESTVSVRDLGSRNGTIVNGKVVKEACVLKDRDLVQIGPLTFAVSIVGAPAAAAPKPSTKAAPEDVSHDDIETWLIADNKNPAPERPSGVYGGDTITINAFKDAKAAKPAAGAKPAAPAAPQPAAPAASKPAPPAVAPKPAAPAASKAAPPAAPKPPAAAPPNDYTDMEFERLSEGAGDAEEGVSEEEAEAADEAAETIEQATEEYVDETNPFYVKKKAPEPAATAKKPPSGDTSDVARDILSKMMERKRHR